MVVQILGWRTTLLHHLNKPMILDRGNSRPRARQRACNRGEFMPSLDDHPTVKHFRERPAESIVPRPQSLDREWLRQLCFGAGVDDVGFVEIERPELADQKPDILWLFPKTKALVSFVLRMNRENIRTPSRSLANLEFHHATDG